MIYQDSAFQPIRTVTQNRHYQQDQQYSPSPPLSPLSPVGNNIGHESISDTWRNDFVGTNTAKTNKVGFPKQFCLDFERFTDKHTLYAQA